MKVNRGGPEMRLAKRHLGAILAMAVALAAMPFCEWAKAQAPPAQGQNAVQPGANFQNAPAAPFLGPNAVVVQPATGVQRGASANADFDSLIDLIVSTVATDSWAENGGGEAEVRPFPGGVFVDAAGTLRIRSESGGRANLDAKRVLPPRGDGPSSPVESVNHARRESDLRYVSLPRLEREIARRRSAGERLDPSMLVLAGLQRVEYLFAYPETGDLVIAGPAGDWRLDERGHLVSAATSAPVVRLDDLLTIWRRDPTDNGSFFGCSINPRQESLARTQAFLASSGARPLAPGQRKGWLAELRDSVGVQDIEIFGIDTSSRAAAVLVAADYHMKLIGMGLEEGVEGVESYLDSIRLGAGETPPPMSVLRWWFTLDYDAVRTNPDQSAFEIVGQGVKVLSENELLAARGERIHTGESDALNRKFAESFTRHFAALAERYPVYAELRNLFDLSMAVAIIRREGLAERVAWQPALFDSADELRLPAGPVPRQVESVIAHRVIQRKHIVAGVSGGVMVAPGDVLATSMEVPQEERAAASMGHPPTDETRAMWWWDAE